MCNFLEYKGQSMFHASSILPSKSKGPAGREGTGSNGTRANELDTKVIYRRYASLFFICAVSPGDNELITLEIIHRYVEVLDRYFGNVRPSSSINHTWGKADDRYVNWI